MAVIAVIADDLTGANDTGVQFAKQGLATVVLLDARQFSSDAASDVVVVDIGSRAVPPGEAYARAAEAARLVSSGGVGAVYMKVDSTLRGNLGPQIDAIMDACGLKLAVAAPAFPKNGRITVGGLHLLNGVPIEASEIARDPKMPVKESYVPALLAAQTRRKVGQVGLKVMSAGEAAIAAELARLAADGVEVVVCDAWRDEQLRDLAAAIAARGQGTLWVGSAGLAEHLPAALGLSGAKRSGPVAVIAGSVSNVTRSQVAKLSERPDVAYIMVTPAALLTDAGRKAEIERCCAAAAAAMREGKNAVLASGYSDDIVAATRREAEALGLNGQQAGDLVAGALGEMGQRLAEDASPSGLVLTGGDIAVAVCLALGATGIRVIREVAPGIPLGELQGGRRDGLKVVTKAGAFGSDDALAAALEVLRQ
ncbi:four-carbon acid sugar kinase family protein [Anaeroselena agilis]|uniref:Four-carbon acid sugar kinase family protein n=1 Tax=Anaeroselena agilis TaxID=3063788 RepID=A0ABU3P1E6_9FIRM|nr:four-carbon acid sugar kinase family protein [Selenomonadales bacterium 4137-cl]